MCIYTFKGGQIHFKTAIQLTALADKESDIVQQFIFYLKAAMHFVVAGLFIDHPGTPCSKEAQSSYKEARKLIKWISKKFENQECSQSQGKYLSMLLEVTQPTQSIQNVKEKNVQKNSKSGQIHFKTAIQLTALADKESDIVQQFIFYLKAAMHFVVAGLFIDHPGTPCSKEAQSSYKEARKLIKWISKKFENQECSQTQGKYLSVLLVLSMKAQAMLDLNLYKSKDSEVKKDVITLNGHFANSSQMAAPVPLSTYSALLRHHHNVGFLQTSFDLWDQADEMVFRTHSEDFFIQLEHQFGSLTLHCSLRKLVLLVSTAIKKIEKDRKGCSTK
ncbi:AF4/FMR2 family member lilli-like [Artemia franciscana]|uniref:AF4/FMR2 family member lilli-like n=1 Tax=Artemia franciscana TaxID=6661 RepID=UPI0032DB0164